MAQCAVPARSGGRGCPGSLLALCLALNTPHTAAMPFVINDDLRGMWNNLLVAAGAVRAKQPDRQLVGFNNAGEYPGARGAVSAGDDGNLNYRKDDLVSAPLLYVTDLELRYRNRFGVYFKLTSWYDYAGKKQSVPHGSIAGGYLPDRRLDDSDYYSYNRFTGARVRDLYVYGNWDFGAGRLTGRLGQQSINWGESLLHTGINAFNPIDFSALGRAGVRQDDALVPVNRIYTNLITRNGVSIEAFYAFDWEASHLPACGTLGQPVDNIADPACYAATAAAPVSDRDQVAYAPFGENPFLTPRTYADKPGGAGQFGLSSRYFVEALDTEFGLYYVNFHATAPVQDLTLCAHGPEGCSPLDGLTLPLNYHDDVEAYAVSAATGVRNIALSAELSHFRHLPVQRNFPELIEGATRDRGIYANRMAAAGDGSTFSGGWKAERTQLLLGGQLDVSPAIGLADALVVIEAVAQWVGNLPDTDEERIGRNGNWGAAAWEGRCEELVRGTQGGCRVDGFATDFSWGYRALVSLSLPRPARGIDLQPQLTWSHDVHGYAVDGSLLQGRQVLSLSLRTLFQRRWFLDLGRSWVNSNTDYDPLRDKEFYSIAVGVAF